jgi:thymidylate synthase (FAD)
VTTPVPEFQDILDKSGYGGSDPERVVEFSARVCTGTQEKTSQENGDRLLRNILEWGHESVLEHVSVVFFITGVSRSLTHELVRHRHLSFSQLSQRYFNHSNASFVVPPLISEDKELVEEYKKCCEFVSDFYRNLLGKLGTKGVKSRLANSAARYVLPNGTSTSIVVSGNIRAFRHFIRLRGSEAADLEIRILAVEILKKLQEVTPRLVHDFEIYKAEDGFPAVGGGISE